MKPCSGSLVAHDRSAEPLRGPPHRAAGRYGSTVPTHGQDLVRHRGACRARSRRSGRPWTATANGRAPGPCRSTTPPDRTGRAPQPSGPACRPCRSRARRPAATPSRSAASCASAMQAPVVELADAGAAARRAAGPPGPARARSRPPPTGAPRPADRTRSKNNGRSPMMSGNSTRPRSVSCGGRAHVYRGYRSRGSTSARSVAFMRTGRGCWPRPTAARPSLIARARVSPTPSTSSRSSIVARIIFCRLPKRCTMLVDDRLGQPGDARQQPVPARGHAEIEVGTGRQPERFSEVRQGQELLGGQRGQRVERLLQRQSRVLVAVVAHEEPTVEVDAADQLLQLQQGQADRRRPARRCSPRSLRRCDRPSRPAAGR